MPYPLTPAVNDVLDERARQLFEKGWAAEHDDAQTEGQIGLAGALVAEWAPYQIPTHPLNWPWDPKHWKNRGRRQDLVVAAALLIAEIERLDRAK